MRRLCTDSSRSYLGRSALHGGVVMMARQRLPWSCRTRNDLAPRSCCPIPSERSGRDPSEPRSAPCSDASRETAEVSKRHSSGSVLHESGRPRRAEHAKQSGAMGDSILDVQARPGQSSSAQAHVAGFMRILCVAREGAYRTLHELPTADPHGGWCGGGG